MMSSASAFIKKHIITALILFITGLCVFSGLSLLQESPGYIDADYYLASGLSLYLGNGRTVPFLWNYLGKNSNIMTPANAYWMPLTNLIVHAGLKISGYSGFFTGSPTGHEAFVYAKIPFVLISALLPVLTFFCALKLGFSKIIALTSGLFFCLPGHFLPFMTSTDSFGPVMAAGLIYFMILSLKSGPGQAVLLGLMCGVIHLARAEGIIWLFLTLSLPLLKFPAPAGKKFFIFLSKYWISVFTGYALITAPLFISNLKHFGRIMPGGGIKGLWLIKYNDIFTFNPDSLTMTSWLAQGIENILKTRLLALYEFICNFIVNQNSSLLLIFFIIGIIDIFKNPPLPHENKGYKENLDNRIYFPLPGSAGAWIFNLLGITAFFIIFFPLQGIRGSYFHASAAFQPFIFIFAALGMHKFFQMGINKRGWTEKSINFIFRPALFAGLILVTLMAVKTKICGAPAIPAWNEHARVYAKISSKLEALKIIRPVVMVNNPPGYWLFRQDRLMGRPENATEKAIDNAPCLSLMIPEGNMQTLKKAAVKFNASILVLEPEHPDYLGQCYSSKSCDFDFLEYLFTVRDSRVYAFRLKPEVLKGQTQFMQGRRP